MNDKLKQIMSEVFKIDSDDINEQSEMNNIDSWDSLSHIALIQQIEKKFQVKIDFTEIVKMTSFTAISEVISSKR